jgi:hypothetical protein
VDWKGKNLAYNQMAFCIKEAIEANGNIIYCDMRGIWDELLVTNGTFAGFKGSSQNLPQIVR